MGKAREQSLQLSVQGAGEDFGTTGTWRLGGLSK